MDTVPLQNQPSRLKVFVVNIFYIGLAIGLAMLIQTFIARPFIVTGNSMDPVIKDKEYLIIDKLSYRLGSPKRGDVVVFRAPPEPSKFYIKRIIGLPGETVTIEGTTITITNSEHPNGFTLEEPFITHNIRSDSVTTTIPEDHFFVMGDNRDASFDSRSWGPLAKEAISGRALLRLLPFHTITYLPGKETYDETK